MKQVNFIDYEKVKEENKELKIILNKLSHEMGNALTLLGASIYFVEANITKTNKKCPINELKNDYTYICNLFKELREYNQTDNINKKEITIGEINSCIESSYKKLQINKAIRFDVIIEGDILSKKILGDIVMLKQVFINVIKNAIEAVEENDVREGMKINVRISVSDNLILKEKEMCFVEGKGVEEIVHIEIADNGKGILLENMDNIFLPMFTAGKKDGTGWGLFIVKRIIEMHEGKVKAVSDQRTGTAIHICLPILNLL